MLYNIADETALFEHTNGEGCESATETLIKLNKQIRMNINLNNFAVIRFIALIKRLFQFQFVAELTELVPSEQENLNNQFISQIRRICTNHENNGASDTLVFNLTYTRSYLVYSQSNWTEVGSEYSLPFPPFHHRLQIAMVSHDSWNMDGSFV